MVCMKIWLLASFILFNGSTAAFATEKVSTPVNYSSGYDYILGPGDSLRIELLGIEELSGVYTIGPDGILYLPRLKGLDVEGLTVGGLRYFLEEEFKAYVKRPDVFITPVDYRPVEIYVGGEIHRPGFYVLPVSLNSDRDSSPLNDNRGSPTRTGRWPTLFDALRAAQGVTPFSDLSNVKVVRKRSEIRGGGKVAATINFFSLIRDGDESVNIRLYDGDVINVGRSDKVILDQLLAASNTNLSPDFVKVFLSGRVLEPGEKELPQGSTLNQALASAGGLKLLRGSVEFLRFQQDGTTDKRVFSYVPSAVAGTYKNPVLMSGDVIRVKSSFVSAGVEVLNEITGPAVGIYSVYSLFKP